MLSLSPFVQGGIGKINYPILADLTKSISKAYGALLPTGDHTLRATYVIDGKGVVRHVTLNDPPIGRSVDEVLRVVAAAKYADLHGEVCPSGWKPGQTGVSDSASFQSTLPNLTFRFNVNPR